MSPIYEEGLGFYRHHILHHLDTYDIHYYGNMKWEAPHITFHPPVAYQSKLPEIYRTTAVNLDIPPLQSIHSVNNRVFDVGANNAFILTEKRADLSRVVDPPEDFTYSSIDDLKEKIGFYLHHSDDRNQASQRLHHCVKNGHTYTHRVEYITDIMGTFLKY